MLSIIKALLSHVGLLSIESKVHFLFGTESFALDVPMEVEPRAGGEPPV